MAPMRRKSQGSIRSPHVKRNIQSQVTYEGWLFKLEGGALKQWKQRWCVLADFCLFFYKAPREEKVVSSILLPSYKINPCSTDDKTSKKFAFKAEHQNMKTYYFAAEDKESMKKWMNAMSLATIMQNPSTCNEDDDDSGFTSYRSRRNRSSSVPTSSCLKQRSNSCGDRVGEMFLGSDDKYPAPAQLYKTQQKQPLYANAPPKPRRLTQTALYSGDFDPVQYDRYVNEESSVRYLPVDTDANNSAHMHCASPYLDASISMPLACEHFSDNMYKMKPARPRSADFLEREHESAIPQYASQYGENRPQRPKSSLEYYNHITDCEDYEFDDYREAVRVQADNFYANKNLMKNRNFQRQTENVTKSDPRLNAHYSSHNCYVPSDSSPSTFPHTHPKQELNDLHSRNDTFDSQYNFKSEQNESMQRLLEWKQRMLQSPLSRRNQLLSSSSDASSKQMNYSHQGLRYSEMYKQNFNVPPQDKSKSYQNQILPSVRSETHRPLNNPQKYESSSPYFTKGDEVDLLYHNEDHEKQHNVSEMSENSNPNSILIDAADNFHQKNIMYCVDSENNEILFSYDNSPTDNSAPTAFHSSHYPPQMHSFSTLSNVNDIGIEPVPVAQYGSQHVKDKYSKHEMTQQDASSNDVEKGITYTSDDEASADSDNKHRHVSGKINSDGLCSRVSSLDVTSKEAVHLKKLVQQSHGLMSRGKRLSVSAGDLLGKTHEELVLLLIQLRRNQSKILKAKEKLEAKIKKEIDGVPQIESQHTSEYCEELHNQILHLEKQYEVMHPLVTLVDNMIKLGSLYGSSNRRSFSLPVLDSAQEETPANPNSNISLQQTSILSKLLTEENDLQKHIKKFNKLEKSLQNEANSISTLHQDKEMLEHTLFGMRNKILDHQDRPAELQKLRKQQRIIEKELIRVKRLLNSSAKKIEDATTKNDQMEQEILHLRQLLQQALKTGSAEMKSQHSRADLEAELTRVQSVLDELANHRHEINNTVEKLKSEACTGKSKGSEVRASPTGVAGSAPLPLRKKHHCMYLETDLDTMVTCDLAVSYEKDFEDIPVYANAEEIISTDDAALGDSGPSNADTMPSTSADPELCPLQDINDADERMKRFYGILPKEKPCEIKTVRIVKRQSERRSRERDKKKVSYDEQSSVWLVEEPDLSSDDYVDTEESGSKKTQVHRPSSINLTTTSGSSQINSQSAHERLFGSSTLPRNGRLPQMNAIKKSKRRHYTVSGYRYMLDPQFSQYFSERPRSRDDVDMERCLRTANTPDIVRSTMKKNDVFDDTLIDRELGLPQKIDIPERYVEIEPEHLSASEKLRRSLKAENICKMLSETTTTYEDVAEKRNNSPEALHKKLSEEKRKRAQLLSLNQALAREVVERSKAVAANVYPLENQAAS